MFFTLPWQTHPSSAALDFGDALLQVQEDAAAEEWARELLGIEPFGAEYMELLVRALLLQAKIPEARQAVDEWVERTGDPGARQELDAMLRQLEEQRSAPDSLPADPEGGQ